MNVDHTDQSLTESPVTGSLTKAQDIDVEIGDLSPLDAGRAADGTRSKLTAAPPPIPDRAKRASLPPPIPRTTARGTNAPKLVEPKASPEMMASWQINPEAPLRPSETSLRSTRPSSPPPIPAAAKAPPPIPSLAPAIPATPLPTTIELVKAIDTPPPVVVQPLVTGNAPSVVLEGASSTALPVVEQELIPSPRESRVAPLPTSQPGADVADLPMWPASAPVLPAPRPSQTMQGMGDVLAQRVRESGSKLPAPRGRNTLPPPVTAPVLVAPEAPQQKPVSALDGSDGWVFEDDYEEREVDGEVVPTTYFERTEPPQQKKSKRLVLIGGGIAAAALVGFVAYGMSTATSDAPAKPAKSVAAAHVEAAPSAAPAAAAPAPDVVPAVAAAPAPAPAPTPEAAPAPVAPSVTTMPITSWPNGATVTLVDNGNATVLGRTPVNAALDPSHSYDVVLAVVGRPTVVKHVDFSTMHEVAVDLDPEPAKQVAVAEPAPAPAVQHHHHHDHAVAAAMPAPAPAHESAKPKHVAIAPLAEPWASTTPSTGTGMGSGTLMVSAKPPCEIVVDGKFTHLTTPQRSISLSPGQHAVTLVNASMHINKTIAVKVEAKKPTKLIQDFTKS